MYLVLSFIIQTLPLSILVLLSILASNKKTERVGKILLTIYIVLLTVPVTFIAALFVTVTFSTDIFYQYAIVGLCSLLSLVIIFAIWRLFKKKIIKISSIIAALICFAILGGYVVYDIHDNSVPVIGESSDLLYQYAPNNEKSKVAVLKKESSLKIDSAFPKLDGATALFPVYSAFAKAVYPETILDGETYVTCTTTAGAYESIITGNADIIFVAAPSDEQLELAKEKGIELEFTPIGSEGFVFFVNSKNPIDNLTVEQIEQIYSGSVTKWSELGVDNFGEIIAFQREEGSGSQSALKRLMSGKKLMDPPSERVFESMGGIIEQTADYKNYKNAIGFSFRFYSTEMVKNKHIKLLSLNGVYPSEENIDNGTYPISSNFFAVTRRDKSVNVQKFLDWMTSEEAQSLVKKTGYTPIS